MTDRTLDEVIEAACDMASIRYDYKVLEEGSNADFAAELVSECERRGLLVECLGNCISVWDHSVSWDVPEVAEVYTFGNTESRTEATIRACEAALRIKGE